MLSDAAVIYQFGAFWLDPAERVLRRDGQPVSLTPKAFDLLVYLVEHHGRLVEKSTLIGRAMAGHHRRGGEPRVSDLGAAQGTGRWR